MSVQEQENISKIDGKMLNYVNSAYRILHLSGYYDGIKKCNRYKRGL